VDEFINLTFCCQEVTVVTDFNNLESLGHRHYLTLGGGASMEEMQGKDVHSKKRGDTEQRCPRFFILSRSSDGLPLDTSQSSRLLRVTNGRVDSL
ncbi:MAG: hypothetical protein VB071_02230, partial [Lawsonibacter sp.]|nr:hypothetical protein [Lawsonibacter sp.]